MPSPSQESAAVAASSNSARDSLLYFVFGLIAQTFVFAIYTLLFCLSTRILLKRKSKSMTDMLMLFTTVVMFFLSAAYWMFTCAHAATMLNAPTGSPISDHDEITQEALLSAIATINFVISDAVVIWRAWIISQHKLRKYLWVTGFFWVLTFIAVLTTIGFRVDALTESKLAKAISLTPGLDVLQLLSWMLSLASNISATSIVAVTTWRHREIVRDAFTYEDGATKSPRYSVLIVEIGVFYSISTLITLLSSLIQLPHGTLGDLYGPISIHIASAYPPIVILLVGMKRSLNQSAFLATLPPGSCPVYPLLRSATLTSTTTVGGPEPTTSITGPDIMHPLAKITSNSYSKPIPSRFSDTSFDTRQEILAQLQKTAFV
ncbi:hypothetical protein B0H19DRAFT_1267340 [Mycena capillaripes]|nr:hypothetical protein B0H19DRAFT_1267340 [Mycena capillaripes]